MKYITRTVWILSFVSLFTDMASEMLYPIMPVYLKSIGFSIVLIGFLEGFAEALAGLSKGYFGKLSDLSGRRVPFVQFGYALSSLCRPLMAVFVQPLWVLFVRSMDKLGKGMRTGARDAILSDEATPETKGKVFGLHRSMDTLGAVIGPLLALVYLAYNPENYKALFFIAFIPGIMAVLASLLLKDNPRPGSKPQVQTSFFSFLNYWKTSPAKYRKVVSGLLLFALFNSSDIFLLLKLKQSGLTDAHVIGAYIFYNLVYATFAFPIGILADKIGLKKIYIAGLILFATVYAGMAFTNNIIIYILLFFGYGLYAAATEGIGKAWITNITDKKDTATAIGTFAGFQSISIMIASSLAGLIWYNFGAEFTFILTAFITVLVILYFIVMTENPEGRNSK